MNKWPTCTADHSIYKAGACLYSCDLCRVLAHLVATLGELGQLFAGLSLTNPDCVWLYVCVHAYLW